MRLSARIVSVWHALFGRRRPEQDLDDELKAYVEERTERDVSQGIAPPDALRLAYAELGGLVSLKLRLREERLGQRVIFFFDSLWDDTRHGVRRLVHTPRFTLPAVLTLGLGIAIAIGTFSVVNALVLRPPPVRDGGNLLVVAASRPPASTLRYLSYPNYLDLRDRVRVFRGLVAYAIVDLRVSDTGLSVPAHGQAVSGNYFPLFGIVADRGRMLTSDDDVPAAEPAIVLSSGFWHRAFAADATAIGRTVRLNGHPFTIVGVAPSAFRGTDALFDADVWVSMSKATAAGLLSLTDRTSWNIRVQGLLAPRITRPQAQASVDAAAAGLRAEYPVENQSLRFVLLPERETRPIIDAAGSLFPVVVFLMAVAAAGLMIDGASVTSLLLARGVARRREMATRLALGATRGRLARQLMVEGVLLSGSSAGVGFGLARGILSGLSKAPLPGGVVVDVNPDRIVAILTVALAVVIGVAISILPALMSPRSGLPSAMADGSRATSGRRPGRLRERIVASQFLALTVLLTVVAIFAASVRRANQLNVGFATTNRLLFTIAPTEFGYDAPRGQQLVRALLDRMTALPAVASAAAVSEPPLGFGSSSMSLAPADRPLVGPPDHILYTVVTPGYFDTLAIPLRRGRSFDERDRADGTPVAVVNETLAKTFWPGENAVGRHLVIPNEQGTRASFEVIGVVKTTKYESATEAPKPFVWFPYAQTYRGSMTLVVQTKATSDEEPVIREARATLARLDSTVTWSDVTTFEKVVHDRATGTLAAGAWFVGLVASVAFLRAAFSLYSLLAYTVQFRAHELAIRMAFGAGSRDVLALVVRRALTLAVSGVVVGLMLAAVVARALRGLLSGTSSVGPTAWIGVPCLLLTVAMLSAYVPVRRFLKESVSVTLRHE